MMQVLIDPDLILERFLNRNSDLFRQSQKLFQFIKKTNDIEFLVVRPSFNKVIEYFKLSQKSPSNAESIIAQLKSLLYVMDGDSEIFNKARHYEDFETGFEIECFLSLHANAIVTQKPQKYLYKEHQALPIWSVDKLIERYSLELSYKAKYNSRQNISLQLSCLESKCQLREKYLIRNTIPIILKAFSVLQSAGYNGLTVDEFQTQIESSNGSLKRIIWDLENFNIAYRGGNRMYVSQYLLDTGIDDISLHIANLFENHVVIKKIYRRIQDEKSITSWGIGEIIEQSLSCQQLSKKSVQDYTCRFLSWLKFARILTEHRQKDHYVLVEDTSAHLLHIPVQVHQQLELPLLTIA